MKEYCTEKIDLLECETAKELMFKILTENGLKDHKNCIFIIISTGLMGNSCFCSGSFQTRNVPW